MSHKHLIEGWIPLVMYTSGYSKYPTECTICKKKLVAVLSDDRLDTYEVPDKDWQEIVNNHGF